MQIKWKCVWKVLKPKIIAALIIITAIIITILIGVFIIGYIYMMTPPLDYTNMNLSDQQMVNTNYSSGGFSTVQIAPIIAFFLIIISGIGIIGLSIEYLKALAESLKPCIIWEKK